MLILFLNPSLPSTTYLLYSSAGLLALRDQQQSDVVESSAAVVAESFHPATISGGNSILSDVNGSSSDIGTSIAAAIISDAQQSCRLCTGMPLDPENDWCLLLESGIMTNKS